MPTRTQQSDLLVVRLRLARRHQARAAVPGRPARVLRVRRRCARPGRAAADADLPDDRSRHRHEPPPVRAVAVGRRAPLRPRQGDEHAEISTPDATSAAISTSTATASRIARCPARTRRAAPTSRAAARATPTRATPRQGPDYVYNMERLLRKFDTAKTLVPQPIVHQAGAARPQPASSTTARQRRRWTRRSACSSSRCGARRALRVRAFPFRDAVDRFIAEHETVFVVEQNRDAQLRTLLINELEDRSGPAGADPALRRHADHRALHRRGDRRAGQGDTTFGP